MNIQNFKQLLLDMDPAEMAPHSVENHHVEGMDYLCLHRSDRMTVKLYFIDPREVQREPGSFLVTPHTHRYAFESTVLVGRLGHIRFKECGGDSCERFQYDPDIRQRVSRGKCGLYPTLRFHGKGSDREYWNGTEDIHTLMTPDHFVLLGLIQYADTAKTSTVYIKEGGDMKYPESSVMRPARAEWLRERALYLLENRE